jgi:alpha,alpha-trehalase
MTTAPILSSLCTLMLAVPMEPPAYSPSIFDYIERTWDVLTRTHRNLALAAADPKFQPLPNGRWPVYVASNEDLMRIKAELRAQMPPEDFPKVDVLALPASGAQPDQGLLYLPRPYVVPGGRFNEMYGWDSFFIQMGLQRDGKLDLAKDMADNFLYEIRVYGKILNANRSYYLSRSQPPFLTEMVLAIYRRTHDRKWLEDALPEIDQYYRYWTREPHLTAETGLSRYFDLGTGPAPEVVSAERDSKGRDDYERVRQYYRTHRVVGYDVAEYYDKRSDQLTELFYKGDLSMRESGFDPSSRFGAFSVDIPDYDPVCLNSLLYLMEVQIAEILEALDRKPDAIMWHERAQSRAERINRLMWDEHDGLYYDYDFVRRRIHRYPFLTTFYPLWTGIASPEQAARVVSNLRMFERPGGLQTSTNRSGDQWDAPFGWAPLQWIAVQGLRKYGYWEPADRISEHFLSLVYQGFALSGTIVEKYDVVRGRSDVSKVMRFGYLSNEAGFGWTNAVFTSLFDDLTPQKRLDLQHRWSTP